MLNTLKKVINLDSKGGDKKVVPSNDTNAGNRVMPKNNNGRGVFAGLNANELRRESSGGLVTARISEEAKESLDKANFKKEDKTSSYSTTSIAETVATLFSEGDIDDALNRLRFYINEHEGKVDKRYWFMLMDIYQVMNDEKSFEKVGLIFSNSFGTSPPSWVPHVDSEKKASVTGKNIIILEQKLAEEHSSKFKEFLKEAKLEKFCRINASQCKFDQSDFAGILHFYKLLVELRKNRVLSVLMGDNNLIGFCKSYIDQSNSRNLREDFLIHEQDFWLFYLELLQWKGKQEEFEELSFEYAMKFELSPPDWDKDGVMSTDKFQSNNQEEVGENKIDKILTYNNIDNLFNIIKEKSEQQNIIEIDLSHVDRIDFASVGSIAHFIQEFNAENENKKLIFHNPNELILILFEMLGINEFATINKKIR